MKVGGMAPKKARKPPSKQAEEKKTIAAGTLPPKINNVLSYLAMEEDLSWVYVLQIGDDLTKVGRTADSLQSRLFSHRNKGPELRFGGMGVSVGVSGGGGGGLGSQLYAVWGFPLAHDCAVTICI